MPGDPGATVVTTLVCYQHTAQEAAGASGTRHSPRPRLGGRFLHHSGALRREIADAYPLCCLTIESEVTREWQLTSLHSSTREGGRDEAIRTPSFRGDAKHRTRNLEIPRCAIAHLRSGATHHPGMTVSLDCFADPIIGRHPCDPLAIAPYVLRAPPTPAPSSSAPDCRRASGDPRRGRRDNRRARHRAPPLTRRLRLKR